MENLEMAAKHSVALREPLNAEAEDYYFRLLRNLKPGDIKEVLIRMSDESCALDELRDACLLDTRNREAVAAVFVEHLELYARECANEACDGRDMVDGRDRRT